MKEKWVPVANKVVVHLKSAEDSLALAVAEMTKIAGGAWISSLREHHKIVRLLLRARSMRQFVEKRIDIESRRGRP